MKLFTRLVALIALMFITGYTHAESLYISQMKQAHWDSQAFDKRVEKLKKHKQIEFAEPLKISPFHFQNTPNNDVQRDFCVTCHTNLPHRESERYRSYLNMHVNFLACTSCHFNPENIDLEYRWYEWSSDSTSNLQSNTKQILPFYQQRAETFSKDHPEISALLKEWEAGDLEKRAELHLKIHFPVDSEGSLCGTCHTEDNPTLDYVKLGFSDEEIELITKNRISRFLNDEAFKDKPIKLMDLLQ
ncbi:MAG: hypothetical protein ABW104_19570 [Candidatus Thiodiazotropha sp. 6PLUC2]